MSDPVRRHAFVFIAQGGSDAMIVASFAVIGPSRWLLGRRLDADLLITSPRSRQHPALVINICDSCPPSLISSSDWGLNGSEYVKVIGTERPREAPGTCGRGLGYREAVT